MEFKVLIVDDEKRARDGLRSQLESLQDSIEVLGEAESVASGLDLIQQKDPDLVFLDVEMNDGTGFDILRKLGKVDFMVVFVTAFDQYAIQAIKFSALDYLLKPLDPDELEEVIKRAKEEFNKAENREKVQNLISNSEIDDPNDRKLAIKCIDAIKYLKINEISHFMADGSYTKIVLIDGKTILASKMLKHFEETLKGFPQFLRIHRSSMINTKFVEEYQYSSGGSVLMVTGDHLYPSDDKKKILLSQLDQLN